MNIYIIGYGNFLHVPSIILRDAFISEGHNVIYKDVESFVIEMKNGNSYKEEYEMFREPIRYSIVEEVDLVIVCQTHWMFEIISKAPIIYYHTEFFWYPSCVNADLIMFSMPEMLEKFMRYFPNFLKTVKDHHIFGYLFNPSNLPQQCDFKNRKKGIYWMGATAVDVDDTHEMRTAYAERARVVGELQAKSLITVFRESYKKNYLQRIHSWEAGLVVNAPGAYFSPRVVEFAAMGIIPILYVGDDIKRKEYYDAFKLSNLDNCYLFSNSEELRKFSTYRKWYKKQISESAIDWAYKYFSAKVKIKEIIDWVMSTVNTFKNTEWGKIKSLTVWEDLVHEKKKKT